MEWFILPRGRFQIMGKWDIETEERKRMGKAQRRESVGMFQNV